MIVDIHTHLWDSLEQLGASAVEHIRQRKVEPWDRPDASTTAYGQAMEPVQHAVILGVEARHIGASISAEQVAGYVRRWPEKYLGFAGIDPMADGYLAELDRAVQLGLVGVTISPTAGAYHPSHSRAMRLYERCDELGLPVMVHPGTHLGPQTAMEYAQPYLFDEVARSLPNLHLILGQMGDPWTDQTLFLLNKHHRVFADVTEVVMRPWQLYNVLWLAYQQGAMEKLLLGSDFPFCTPQKAIVSLYSANRLAQGTNLPTVPREQLRSIVERDVFSCLGLARPAGLAEANHSQQDSPVVMENREE